MTGFGWLVVEDQNGVCHVVPKKDDQAHTINDVCWCDPTSDDGVMVHHSADGREKREQQ